MWGAIISGLVSLYANYRAQQQTQESDKTALAQEHEAAVAKQTAINRAKEAQAPALNYLKNVVAQGGTLTPAQQQYTLDTRQQTGSALSSRLGGRAATAIASRAATEVSNNTFAANQQRADQAATNLANPGINGANLELAAGQSQAQDAAARAQSTRAQGETDANATLAAGSLISQGIGQYSSGRGTEDLLNAIRANSVRTSTYPASSSETPEWETPSYKLR